MRSPFYRVYVLVNKKKTDISEYVSGFDFEDCLEEDNQVEFRIDRQRAIEFLNNKSINENARVYFQFGFLGEVPSPVHTAIIKDIDASYSGSGVTVTVRALDEGVDSKRNSSTKIWKKMTSSQIAKAIADSLGMTAVIEPTTKVWASKPQGNKSDVEFLKMLAAQETDGDYIFYMRSGKLYFVKRNLKEKSKKTYTWNNGEGDLISFRPQYRESTKKKGAGAFNLSTFDDKTKKGKDTVSDNKTQKGGTTLGDKMLNVWDAVPGEKRKRVPAPKAVDKDLANNLANHKKKKGDLKVLTCGLVTIGNPALEPNMVITVGGVADRHSGNWLIEKVKHSVSSSGYTCQSHTVKNGQKKGKDTPKSKNTSVGPKKQKATVKIKAYDAVTGNQITKRK